MIDLREKDKQRIIELAEKILPEGTQIWAFGSRVKGTNHDTSDLDLVLFLPSKQDDLISDLADLKYELQDSNIPILIQLFSWWHIPTRFQENISQCYEVLHIVGPKEPSKEDE